MWRGACHSRDEGVRGVVIVYAPSLSVIMHCRLVNVTECPAATMSWTHTRAVLNLSGTREVL